MTRIIEKDEVALVLSPTDFDKDGNWTGELATGLVVGEHDKMGIDDLAYLIHLATLMSAFLQLAQEDEGLYNDVEDYRNDKMGLDSDTDPLYEEVEGTEGKVVKLTKFTKTFGSA